MRLNPWRFSSPVTRSNWHLQNCSVLPLRRSTSGLSFPQPTAHRTKHSETYPSERTTSEHTIPTSTPTTSHITTHNDPPPPHLQSCMVPRPLPYPSTHPNKGIYGANTAHPSHFFATYPSQNFEILKRIYWKRRGYFMAVNIPSLPEVEQISTNITRILGGNPSKFTLQGTNTYLLGSGKERILVDTAQGFDAWRDSLVGVLGKAGDEVKVKSCILTHWHHDHVMGIPEVKKHSPDVTIYKHLGNSYDPDKTMTNEQIHDIKDGQKFSVAGNGGEDDIFEVEALHTPGHAKDHMCLVITKSPDPAEIGCIFTADNVLGHGTAVFEDLATYISSLHLMKQRTGDQKRAFPGHGAVIVDAQAKFDEYILHRKMREDEAMNVLVYGTTARPGERPLKTAEGFPQSQQPSSSDGDATESGLGKELVFGKEWESMDMVKIIYRMYPESLWEPAQGGLLQVLEKLRGDGKVVKTEGGKWKASEEVVKKASAEARNVRSKSPNKL